MNSAPDNKPAENRPRHIVLAGGNGFLAKSLSEKLLARGDRVIALCRPGREGATGVATVHWDARNLGAWAKVLDGADVLINFVGRSVDCRKTPGQRAEIMSSRVDSVKVLGEAFRKVSQPAPVWLQCSTAHIHGDPVPEDTVVVDSSPVGEGLAPKVGLAWEAAFHEAKLPEQRGVLARTSFVLGAGGGALDRLALLTKWFAGGTVGPGTQWISWIHEDDMNGFWLRAMEDESFEGSYLVTAPHPVTNREFMATMRKAWNRPWSPPAPTFAVKLGARYLLKTDPELALLGRRCLPQRLSDEHGFRFRWPEVLPALHDMRERRR